ncbi:MAG: WD40/YVTN/BNR-like repeat-containing protein [Candidatus Geothermincolia bacterium]
MKNPSLKKTVCAVVMLSLAVALPSLAFPVSNASAASTWVRQASGTTSILHGVFGTDASHVWAVGADGAILFYDGTGWTVQDSPGGIYYAVHALDANNVWAVGYDGAIAYFDGSVWEDQSLSALTPLSGVYAADATHVWAVGGSGSIYFYNGSNWSQQYASGTILSFESVSGTDATHVWAVGGKRTDAGFVGGSAFFDGASWTEFETGAAHTLFAISALDANHVWAVGGGGEIRFFNGSAWIQQASGTDEIIEGVCGWNGGKALAVTDGGAVFACSGSSWAREDSGVTTRLTCIFALDDGYAWACGDEGVIIARQPVAPVPTSRTWGHDSIGVPEAAVNWYLAEGCTGGDFETWVLVQNPNTTPASVKLTYMTAGGPVDGPSEKIPANSRKTYNAADKVPNTWEVSTRVQADVPVIAERAMYGNGRMWGHDSTGASQASKTWYLAEGCTGGDFETWVLVQNPNGQAASVGLTYMTSKGLRTGQKATIPGNSRKTFNVADMVKNEWEVSTRVDSDIPVIAERAMYGGGRKWGHDSIGVTGGAKQWFLAEGCTGTGFETWVLVQNPNNSSADVDLTYMTAKGPVKGPSVSVPANSRQTFDVGLGVPDNYSVSTEVTANAPVIAERSMYGGSRTWGHDSIGTIAPNLKWYLAEGSTGAGFETWVLVQNPNGQAAQVDVMYMTSAGPVTGPSISVAGQSRVTINVAGTVNGEWEVSTMVTSNRPVIAERAMYGNRQ